MESTQQAEEQTRLIEAESLQSARSPMSTHPSVWRILLPATAVVFILGAGNQLSLASSTAIPEQIICSRYYFQDIDAAAATVQYPPFSAEHLEQVAVLLDGADRCKVEPIQSELSYILGWRDVFENLPAILLAMPYGVLSDRIGRRKVMILATLGVVLNDSWIRLVYWFPTLPIRLVWLSGLWQTIGAGAPTLTSIVFAQVADVCPPEQRSVAFSYIQAALMVPQIVFLPIGSAFISFNPWIPMFATTALGAIAILIACLTLPETFPIVSERDRQHGEGQPLLDRENSNNPSKSDLRSRLLETAKHVTKLFYRASSNPGVTCVLLCLFAFNFGLQADGIMLLLYASKRLQWSLDSASLFLSLRTIVTLTILSLLLPVLSKILLVKLKLSERAKNKLLTEVCGLCLAVGAAIIFLAKSWVTMVAGQLVFSAGSVFLVPARSLLAGLAEQKHAGALFTLSAVMLHGGLLSAAPIMAASFKWGMKLGDFWMGMPFLVALGFFLFGTVLLLPIALEQRHSAEDNTASLIAIEE